MAGKRPDRDDAVALFLDPLGAVEPLIAEHRDQELLNLVLEDLFGHAWLENPHRALLLVHRHRALAFIAEGLARLIDRRTLELAIDLLKKDRDLKITLEVNGVLKQNSNSGNMIFNINEQIADLSRNFALRPGARSGALATIDLDPGFEYFTIDNRVITTDAAGGTSIRVTRVSGTRQIILAGVITTRSAAVREMIAVDDPALFSAYALYDALLRRGIPVRGRPVARHRTVQVLAPQEGRVLATRTSPPDVPPRARMPSYSLTQSQIWTVM